MKGNAVGFWRCHKLAPWFRPRGWLSCLHLGARRLFSTAESSPHTAWAAGFALILSRPPRLVRNRLAPPLQHTWLSEVCLLVFCHGVGSLLQETPPLGVFAYFSPQSCQSSLKKLSAFLVFPAALGEPLPAGVGGFGVGSLVRLVEVTLKSEVDFCFRLYVLSFHRAGRAYKGTTKSRQRSDLVCSSQ